ncbi:MAG: hypothetical protein AABM31_02725, partial [Actinomycetota bacterium]
ACPVDGERLTHFDGVTGDQRPAAVISCRNVLPAVLLGVSAIVLQASGAQAATPSLDYRCTPNPSNCAGWYRGAVTLKWGWDNLTASPTNDGDCGTRVFTADTAGTAVFCEVSDDATGDSAGRTVTISVDRTPPSIASAGPLRSTDRNGWFNRPFAFRFVGQDATSGVESCSTGSYGGPDGGSVNIDGSCRDVAGNVGSGSFTMNYDATPPPPPSVEATPGNRRVHLKWSSPPGTQAVVERRARGRAAKVVFSGPGAKFADRRLRNGRRYRYVVRLMDQAGNRAVGEATAVPTASRLLVPANGAHLRRPPRLVWRPVRRARYYNVQLVRRGKILSRWPRTARLQLRRRWKFAGHRFRLVPGRYCWYVWPGLGARSEHRYGRGLGKSCFIYRRR